MTLRLTDRHFDRPSFEKLVEGLPPEWVEEALAAAGTATVRRRRLPAEQSMPSARSSRGSSTRRFALPSPSASVRSRMVSSSTGSCSAPSAGSGASSK